MTKTKRRAKRGPMGSIDPFAPFMAWNDLGWKTAEMMMASAQVVAHRTNMMATSSFPPSAADQAEFNLMTQEKVDAAQESLWAATTDMMQQSPLNMMKVMQGMMGLSFDFVRLAGSQTIPEAVRNNARLGRGLRRTAIDASRLSNSAVGTAGASLKPIHKAATDNASRLGKPKA